MMELRILLEKIIDEWDEEFALPIIHKNTKTPAKVNLEDCFLDSNRMTILYPEKQLLMNLVYADAMGSLRYIEYEEDTLNVINTYILNKDDCEKLRDVLDNDNDTELACFLYSLSSKIYNFDVSNISAKYVKLKSGDILKDHKYFSEDSHIEANFKGTSQFFAHWAIQFFSNNLYSMLRPGDLVNGLPLFMSSDFDDEMHDYETLCIVNKCKVTPVCNVRIETYLSNKIISERQSDLT